MGPFKSIEWEQRKSLSGMSAASIFNHKVPSLEGEGEFDLSTLRDAKNKAFLIVNVASK